MAEMGIGLLPRPQNVIDSAPTRVNLTSSIDSIESKRQEIYKIIEKMDLEEEAEQESIPAAGAGTGGITTAYSDDIIGDDQLQPEDMMLKKIMLSKMANTESSNSQSDEFMPQYHSKAQIIDGDFEYQKLSTLNDHIKNDNFSYRDKVLLVYHQILEEIHEGCCRN